MTPNRVRTMKCVMRRITANEWRELRAMRLEFLLDSPDAFGVRHADAAVITGHMWREQATTRRAWESLRAVP
ncbi:hypothetical protein TK78_14975 [Streptomyces sp. Tue 6075]|nr:hypothetical protein TK78_14975 [Streptomyces sp. Tue 6075]